MAHEVQAFDERRGQQTASARRRLAAQLRNGQVLWRRTLRAATVQGHHGPLPGSSFLHLIIRPTGEYKKRFVHQLAFRDRISNFVIHTEAERTKSNNETVCSMVAT